MTTSDKLFLGVIFAIFLGTAFAFRVAVHRLHQQEQAMGIVEMAR